jgi:CheY-like chemotaxis protein
VTKRILAEILVVDDDSEARQSLADLLELEGYAVRTAVTGRDALSSCQCDGPPDVILLDLQMPVMNGWELTRALKRSRTLSRVPVVVLSASVDVLPPPAAAAMFAKPVDLGELLGCLRSLIGEQGGEAAVEAAPMARQAAS